MVTLPNCALCSLTRQVRRRVTVLAGKEREALLFFSVFARSLPNQQAVGAQVGGGCGLESQGEKGMGNTV